MTVEGSPPEVLERPEGGDWQIGETIKLVGKMAGQPQPQVHWEFMGKEITEKRFKIYEDSGYSFMELQSAAPQDQCSKYAVFDPKTKGGYGMGFFRYPKKSKI